MLAGQFPKSAGSSDGFWGSVDFSKPEICGLPDVWVSTSESHPHLAIAAEVQLHNRGDLLRALRVAAPASAQPDDRELLLAAYAKWGTGCANYLLGEFAFAIWDKRDRRLFCCRDHIGFKAFLYWRGEARFVFGGDLAPILECDGVPRKLNRRKLADMAFPSGETAHPDETFHEGILSLPPGTWMTIEPGRTVKQKYWELGTNPGLVVPRRPDDALEALREILFEAVDCRLDADYPVAALLSGGLDSSSVVSIAARCLEKRNRQLTAISAVLPEETRAHFKDEREYIAEFHSWHNVRIEYVTAPGRGPFDCLDDLSRFAVFPLRFTRFYLNEECEKTAIASGARSLLWGVRGEFGPTARNDCYFLELAVGLRWVSLARELRNCGRVYRNVSPIRRLAGQLRNTLFPNRRFQPLAFLAGDLLREYKPGPAWKNRSFSQRGYQTSLIRYWLNKHAMGRGQTINLIPPVTPLLDKRILEFCLALPASMDTRDGYQRYLIRGALDGILPKRIQWRTDKLPYSPDYFVRYNAQLGMARNFVAAIGPKDPVRSVVDVERIEKSLYPVDPIAGGTTARDQIPATMYLINFLRQFSDFRP